MPRRKLVLEDPEAKPLPDGWEDMTPGEVWRTMAKTPHPKKDPTMLRVILEGDDQAPLTRYEVEIYIDLWVAVWEIRRVRGVWEAVGVSYRPRFDGVAGEPSARQMRRANIERHRHRIDALLENAEDQFREVFPKQSHQWLQLARYQWAITAPRSRRGRGRRVDVDEVVRLRESGLTDRQIAKTLRVHPKTPANVVAQAKGRVPWQPGSGGDD